MSDTYSYDAWKTTEPEIEPSKPVRHRCLQCGWTGNGAEASAHHRDRHHRIEVVGLGILAVFSCCANRVAEKRSA